MEQIEKIQDGVLEFIENGFLDNVWYYIKDIKNYEIQFYLDPYSEDIDSSLFNEFLLKYSDYEGEYGILTGRLNYKGFLDRNDNLHKIKIYESINESKVSRILKPVNEYELGKRSHSLNKDKNNKEIADKTFTLPESFYGIINITAKDNNKYSDINLKNPYNPLEVEEECPYFDISDLDFLYKCNETIFLLLYSLVWNQFYENKLKYIDKLQFNLDSGDFDCCIIMVGNCNIKGFPYREKIIGFDRDEWFSLIPSASFLQQKSLISEFNKLSSHEENIPDVNLFMNSLKTDLIKYGIKLTSGRLGRSDLDNLFPIIESKFKRVYRKNIKKILHIVNSLEQVKGENTPKIYSKIRNEGINLWSNGLTNIRKIIYDIIVPYFDLIDFNYLDLQKLRSYEPHIAIVSELRNHDLHDDSRDENVFLIGIFLCLQFFNAIQLCDEYLDKIEINSSI